MSNLVLAEPADVLLDRASEFSWKAVFAGAVVATAVTLFLLTLGTGVGLSLIGPTPHDNTAAHALTLGGIYFFAAQAFGLVVGGYLAGRLMGPVLETESEEIFHASAHGLVVWALTVVVTTTMITLSALTTATSAMNGGALYVTANMSHAPAAGSNEGLTGYWVDTLFRMPNTAAPAASATEAGQPPSAPSSVPQSGNSAAIDARAEANRILTVAAMDNNQLSRADHDQLSALISQSTGISAPDAGRRVDDVLSRITQQQARTADIARKGMEYASLLLAASLIFGALVSAGAAVSGRWTDDQARGAIE